MSRKPSVSEESFKRSYFEERRNYDPFRVATRDEVARRGGTIEEILKAPKKLPESEREVNPWYTDDLWGDDLPSEVVEECIFLASQKVLSENEKSSSTSSGTNSGHTNIASQKPTKQSVTFTQNTAVNNSIFEATVLETRAPPGSKKLFGPASQFSKFPDFSSVKSKEAPAASSGFSQTLTASQRKLKTPTKSLPIATSSRATTEWLREKLEKVQSECQELKADVQTKDGEVKILRDKLQAAQRESEKIRNDKVKAVETIRNEMEEKIRDLQKQLSHAKTEVLFKTKEAEASIEKYKELKNMSIIEPTQMRSPKLNESFNAWSPIAADVFNQIRSPKTTEITSATKKQSPAVHGWFMSPLQSPKSHFPKGAPCKSPQVIPCSQRPSADPEASFKKFLLNNDRPGEVKPGPSSSSPNDDTLEYNSETEILQLDDSQTCWESYKRDFRSSGHTKGLSTRLELFETVEQKHIISNKHLSDSNNLGKLLSNVISPELYIPTQLELKTIILPVIDYEPRNLLLRDMSEFENLNSLEDPETQEWGLSGCTWFKHNCDVQESDGGMLEATLKLGASNVPSTSAAVVKPTCFAKKPSALCRSMNRDRKCRKPSAYFTTLQDIHVSLLELSEKASWGECSSLIVLIVIHVRDMLRELFTSLCDPKHFHCVDKELHENEVKISADFVSNKHQPLDLFSHKKWSPREKFVDLRRGLALLALLCRLNRETEHYIEISGTLDENSIRTHSDVLNSPEKIAEQDDKANINIPKPALENHIEKYKSKLPKVSESNSSNKIAELTADVARSIQANRPDWDNHSQPEDINLDYSPASLDQQLEAHLLNRLENATWDYYVEFCQEEQHLVNEDLNSKHMGSVLLPKINENVVKCERLTVQELIESFKKTKAAVQEAFSAIKCASQPSTQPRPSSTCSLKRKHSSSDSPRSEPIIEFNLSVSPVKTKEDQESSKPKLDHKSNIPEKMDVDQDEASNDLNEPLTSSKDNFKFTDISKTIRPAKKRNVAPLKKCFSKQALASSMSDINEELQMDIEKLYDKNEKPSSVFDKTALMDFDGGGPGTSAEGSEGTEESTSSSISEGQALLQSYRNRAKQMSLADKIHEFEYKKQTLGILEIIQEVASTISHLRMVLHFNALFTSISELIRVILRSNTENKKLPDDKINLVLETLSTIVSSQPSPEVLNRIQLALLDGIRMHQVADFLCHKSSPKEYLIIEDEISFFKGICILQPLFFLINLLDESVYDNYWTLAHNCISWVKIVHENHPGIMEKWYINEKKSKDVKACKCIPALHKCIFTLICSATEYLYDHGKTLGEGSVKMFLLKQIILNGITLAYTIVEKDPSFAKHMKSNYDNYLEFLLTIKRMDKECAFFNLPYRDLFKVELLLYEEELVNGPLNVDAVDAPCTQCPPDLLEEPFHDKYFLPRSTNAVVLQN